MFVRRNARKKGKKAKLLPKFVGPFQIRRQLGPLTHLWKMFCHDGDSDCFDISQHIRHKYEDMLPVES